MKSISLLKTKIELTLRLAELVGMRLARKEIGKVEEDKTIRKYIENLYDYIKQLEPRNESEIL